MRAKWRSQTDELKKSSAGRKPLDAILMFRMLVLQALNNLSDEQVEYQVRERLSSSRFLGLAIEDSIPDATTLWLFREKLAKARLIEKLFDRFDRRNSTPAAAPCRNGDRLTLLFDGLALPFDLSTGTQGLFGQSRLGLQPVFASFPLSVGTAGLGQLSQIAVKDAFCLALPSSEQGVPLVDFSRRLLVSRYREACPMAFVVRSYSGSSLKAPDAGQTLSRLPLPRADRFQAGDA